MNPLTHESNEYFLGLLKSFGVHALLAISIMATTFFFADEIKKLTNPSKVEIIRSAVKVDIVGMPKYTLQELKKMTMDDFQPAPAQEEKAPSKEGGKEDIAFEQPSKKIDVNNLLASYGQKKIEIKKNEAAPKNLDTSKLKNLVLEGNKLSQGNALIGDTIGDVDSTEFSNYATNLPNVIRPFWKLPSYLMKENLKCRLRVFISEAGELIKVDVYESSGNPDYDNRAQDAIRRVGRFPLPSSKIAGQVAAGSIVLGFPL